MRTFTNLVISFIFFKTDAGLESVSNKVEMHTDGKPRVVRVCDVGVSKGVW